MTALTLDQLLETEAIFYQVARTGMDDWIKEDLTQVVLCTSGDENEHKRSQELLRPMALHDEQCRSAQGMLGRAIRLKLTELTGTSRFYFGAASMIKSRSVEGAEAIGRRLDLMVATVRAFLHDEPGWAWQQLEPCTTADRTIVLGFTAVILRNAVTGKIDVDPVCGHEHHDASDGIES